MMSTANSSLATLKLTSLRSSSSVAAVEASPAAVLPSANWSMADKSDWSTNFVDIQQHDQPFAFLKFGNAADLFPAWPPSPATIVGVCSTELFGA